MAVADETNCCCGVPQMKDPLEKQLLVMGGVLNIILPFGTGALVCGVATKNKQLTTVGLLQLASAFILFGGLWSMIYGVLMIIQGMQLSETTSTSEAGVEGGQNPQTPAEPQFPAAAPAPTVEAQPPVDTPLTPDLKTNGAPDPAPTVAAQSPLDTRLTPDMKADGDPDFPRDLEAGPPFSGPQASNSFTR